MKLPDFIVRHGETWIVPIILGIVYGTFVVTAGVRNVAALVVAAFFLLVVFALWFAFRRLKLHAAASRLAGVGDPDGLLALVERELPRQLTDGARQPLHLHAAIAHNLKGDFAAARQALDRSGLLQPRGRRSRGWVALAAATDVVIRSEQGDVAGARAAFERLRPFTVLTPFGGMDLVTREAEARVLLAEGKPGEARERIAPLVKDIRLTDATRAQLHALVARAADALGEADAAADHRAKAKTLAPRIHL